MAGWVGGGLFAFFLNHSLGYMTHPFDFLFLFCRFFPDFSVQIFLDFF
jgi:hypothetical protein